MKILLAEDEQDLREVLTEYLQEFDHEVSAFENGLLALEESRRNAFDVPALDEFLGFGSAEAEALGDKDVQTLKVFVCCQLNHCALPS